LLLGQIKDSLRKLFENLFYFSRNISWNFKNFFFKISFFKKLLKLEIILLNVLF